MTPVRLAPIFLIVLILAAYHSGGLHFLFWADSLGYVAQADSLFSSGAYQRPSARSVGYPLFVAGAFALSRSALSIIVAQIVLVVLAFALLAGLVRTAIMDVAPVSQDRADRVEGLLLFLLAASTSYSALHVFTLSVLPEVLHAVLALVAVMSVGWFVQRAPGTPQWWPASIAAIASALPAVVKPHWLFAAAALVVIVAAKVAWTEFACRSRHYATSILRALLGTALPIAVFAATLAPDRYLAAIDPKTELFGPRTLFCNHLHMIERVSNGKATWGLHPDADLDAQLTAAARKLLAAQPKPWTHIGFNGDHCMFSPGHQRVVGNLLPDPAAQRAYYMAGFKAAVLGDPIGFVWKILRQVVLGLERSFAKFSFHIASPIDPAGAKASLTGTIQNGEAGPLGSKVAMKDTRAGRIFEAVLAVLFTALTVVFMGLTMLSVIIGPLRFWYLDPERKRQFMAYVAVPVIAILAHHTLIATAHTFDIWRYAFGTFFISLGFMITAGLFWWSQRAWLRSFWPAGGAAA